jgi:hypothetical protein
MEDENIIYARDSEPVINSEANVKKSRWGKGKLLKKI